MYDASRIRLWTGIEKPSQESFDTVEVTPTRGVFWSVPKTRSFQETDYTRNQTPPEVIWFWLGVYFIPHVVKWFPESYTVWDQNTPSKSDYSLKWHLKGVFFEAYQKRAVSRSQITPGIRHFRHFLEYYDSDLGCILYHMSSNDSRNHTPCGIKIHPQNPITPWSDT